MRIAVTGGNGDMGRSLIPYLLEQNHTVVSIDRALPATHMPGVEFLIADTRDFGQFCKHSWLRCPHSPGRHSRAAALSRPGGVCR